MNKEEQILSIHILPAVAKISTFHFILTSCSSLSDLTHYANLMTVQFCFKLAQSGQRYSYIFNYYEVTDHVSKVLKAVLISSCSVDIVYAPSACCLNIKY